MKFFVLASDAPTAKSKESVKVALIVAGIFVVLAVAQLFTFEKFAPLITSYGIYGGEPVTQLIGSVIVVLEVAALPFLLRMRLGLLSRFVSMVSGWLAAASLFTAQLLLNGYVPESTNSGLLGATVDIPLGWWSVALTAGLGVLIAWASWGLWPRRTAR